MNWIEALILGIVQGLTEFLPVSSSGHLEIGKVMLGVNTEKSLIFTVVVHGATVLSTLFVFWKDIRKIFQGLIKIQWNDETRYAFKLIISMIPVALLGFFFSEEVETLFNGNMLLVGSMLLFTALLLTLSNFAGQRQKSISYFDSLVIGLAQTLAVIPGISRSGATISTGLLLKNKKDGIAKFSFLMVLVPIIGANLKDMIDGKLSSESDITLLSLSVGFLAAFFSGLLACKWMVNIVNKGKLIYFALYCAIIGLGALVYHFQTL